MAPRIATLGRRGGILPPLRTELEAVLDHLVEAWNSRDGARFAALFAEQSDYVTGDAEWLRGRQAIGRLVERAGPGPDVVLEPEPSVRVHGDYVSVTFRWVARQDDGRTARGVMTGLLVRTPDGWLFDRLQNTDVAESR